MDNKLSLLKSTFLNEDVSCECDFMIHKFIESQEKLMSIVLTARFSHVWAFESLKIIRCFYQTLIVRGQLKYLNAILLL